MKVLNCMFSWEFISIDIQAFNLSRIPVSSTVRRPVREHSKCLQLLMVLGVRRTPSTCA